MAEQQPGYSERDDEPTTPPTGGNPEDLEDGGKGATPSPAEDDDAPDERGRPAD